MGTQAHAHRCRHVSTNAPAMSQVGLVVSQPTETLLAMHPSWLTVAGRKMLRVATPLHTACRVSGCSDLDDKV